MSETNNIGYSVDEEIYSCLDLDDPKSFFLFAGAGSGKTRSLVTVLEKFRDNNAERLRRCGQQVAIITFTNAACDEIKRRLDFDPTFVISTIHSFSWELIRPYHDDIRKWLRSHLESKVKELEEQQKKGRAGTKAAADRLRQIAANKKRLDALASVRQFVYNPNGENFGKDALNHTEVIGVTAQLLQDRPLLQKILVRQYPVLLVDESQDTNKGLLEAFFSVQAAHSPHFTLGLFGDTMQRIYQDGKLNLGEDIPDTWAKPAKIVNYRCPTRIIRLINKIRFDVDGQNQQPASANEEGFARLFIVGTGEPLNKTNYETKVAAKMAEITGDREWTNAEAGVKILTLEHHMAARRGDFSDFFDPLYAVDKLKTGLISGTLPGISLFKDRILPLIDAIRRDDRFAVCRIVKAHSSILNEANLRDSTTPLEKINKASEAVEALYALWNQGHVPSLKAILKEVCCHGLFDVPEAFATIAGRQEPLTEVSVADPEIEGDRDEVIDAWDKALECSFAQFEKFARYISDGSRFGTHQGVKGLEYPRVMVIVDDEEARGFLFSYDTLFGAKKPTASAKKNESDGKETSMDRTRRLFYVTCSRAKKSLAIVAYTKDPGEVKKHAMSQEWFDESEIVYGADAVGLACGTPTEK